ncbi:MAG TPA: TolC family protein [Bacteroidales bacterium]|nr:TolC family protein [Bacteroidales bacterium]
MKKVFYFSAIAGLFLSLGSVNAQEIRRLTLEEVIKLSEEQSPQALIAKHRFRSSYWQYRSFRANYLPSLKLDGTAPNYTNSYSRVYRNDEWQYVQTDNLQAQGSLALKQNIGVTGGSVSLQSDLTYEKDNVANTEQFVTVPVSIRLNQPIFAYNSLKWEKKIQPVQYEIAKKTYLKSMEGVHSSAVSAFFQLATQQIALQIDEYNLANSDTLYKMADGRYKLGTISEDELLNLQLQYLNATTALKQTRMNLRNAEIRLRSFLGFNDNINIEIILPDEIPALQINPEDVIELAKKNNPDYFSEQLSVIQAQSQLAQAKANRGFSASISANYGLQGRKPTIEEAYKYDLLSGNQGVRLNFSIPILDWGLGQGKYKMAKSSLELAQVQYDQSIQELDQTLYLDVAKFNLQYEQVMTSALSDTIAMKRYEVAKQRFMIGKIDILSLSDADSRKDTNRRSYVQALQNYWNYFYNMRSITLYDFINKKPIETDYDELMN